MKATVIYLFIIVSCLNFGLVVNLKLSYNPNDLRLQYKSEILTNLLASLLKLEQYDILLSFLRAESSDFTANYCNSWKSSDDTDKILKIMENYKIGKIGKEALADLLLPDCFAKSPFLVINLTEEQIRLIPKSFLEVKDFPVHLLINDNLEVTLQSSVMLQPFNPRIKWSEWILYPGFDFWHCSTSPFFYRFAWQFVDFGTFYQLSEGKKKCLLEWLVNEQNPEDFSKLPDEDVLMRILTLFSWNSPELPSLLPVLKERLLKWPMKSPSIRLCFDLLDSMADYPKWDPIDLLFRVISILEPYVLDHLIIGDWFIGILSLWKENLKSFKPSDTRNDDKFQKLFNFVLNRLEISFQGVLKFTLLFDSSMKPLIVAKMVVKYKNHLKSFYQEYPNFFQEESSTIIPLSIRWKTLLKRKRTFSTFHGPFLLRSSLDAKYSNTDEQEDFLFYIADNFRRGTDDLPSVSLNPAISFKRRILSFKCMTTLFLQSVKNIPFWFESKDQSKVIPTPKFPNLFWELLGYFLVQAASLNVSIPFFLQRDFFLEMMKPESSTSYIQALADPFRECQAENVNFLVKNLMERFTVASIISPERHEAAAPVAFQGIKIDCNALVSKIYQNGMKSMRKGINHVLKPFIFTPEELYFIIFKE